MTKLQLYETIVNKLGRDDLDANLLKAKTYLTDEDLADPMQWYRDFEEWCFRTWENSTSPTDPVDPTNPFVICATEAIRAKSRYFNLPHTKQFAQLTFEEFIIACNEQLKPSGDKDVS